jgi:hypothetical protein
MVATARKQFLRLEYFQNFTKVGKMSTNKIIQSVSPLLYIHQIIDIEFVLK